MTLYAKKSLGQHFLRDANITGKIVRLCGDLSALNVVEIGPGPGALTRAILAVNPASYLGIEKDERCIQPLTSLLAEYPVKSALMHGDALRVSAAEHSPTPRAIIANLPYNVGTELLIGWLKEIYFGGGILPHTPSASPPRTCSVRNSALGVELPLQKKPYRFLTLMFQKEVVDRIVAAPGCKDYGRLSVLAQWLCEAESLFDIPPTAFVPPPKVMSSVVRLVPRAQPEPCELSLLEKLTAAAFGQRRKMLRVSLKPLGGEALLVRAGIEPTLRAENLTVSEFVRLANLLDA